MNSSIKSKLRKRIWDLMLRKGIATFPLPPHGRIPNFIGAEKAADRLSRMNIYRSADVVKINPDSPQKPVRYLALSDGKVVIMPTPRISKGFLLLNPRLIPSSEYQRASTIKGAFKYGKIIHPRDLPNVDLIVVGSVVVDVWGSRLGKGEGYSELEYGILSMLGKVDESTPIVTTVHDVQVISERIPRDPWDYTVDYIITPTRVVRALEKYRPKGILWELLPKDKIREIPLLRKLRDELGVKD